MDLDPLFNELYTDKEILSAIDDYLMENPSKTQVLSAEEAPPPDNGSAGAGVVSATPDWGAVSAAPERGAVSAAPNISPSEIDGFEVAVAAARRVVIKTPPIEHAGV